METQKPLVSVVITTYNHSGLIRHSIRSVVEQDYRPIEVLVCDDGSTDDTPRIAQSLASDIVKYVPLKHSGLPAVSMTEGLKMARGDIIMCLEGDDQYLPGKISRQVAHLNAHPDHDFIFSDFYYCEGDETVEKGYMAPDPAKNATWSDFNPVVGEVTVEKLFNPPVHINTVALRRKVRDHILPGNDFRYLWDWDFYIRLVKSGYQLHYMPDRLMAYRKHRKGLTSKPDAVLRVVEERLRIFDRYKDDVSAPFYWRTSERERYNWMKESIKFKLVEGLQNVLVSPYLPLTSFYRAKTLYYYFLTWLKYTFTSWKP